MLAASIIDSVDLTTVENKRAHEKNSLPVMAEDVEAIMYKKYYYYQISTSSLTTVPPAGIYVTAGPYSCRLLRYQVASWN